MHRNKRLLHRRIKQIGLFYDLKRASGEMGKAAIIEIAEALKIGQTTVVKNITTYNRECDKYV